jgi:hypothetical protein
MKTMAQHIKLALLLSSIAIVVGGCAGSGPKGPSDWKMPWSKKDKPPKPYPNPVKMAVTWTPDTLTQAGRTPTRGFGGRLFFFDEKIRPVPVEGDLTVQAIAENPDGSIGEVKRYQFTAEQFTQHFSQTDIGASYSIWIPWDAVGGEQMKISLVPSFRTAGGKLVQGEQALVGLPGRRHVVDHIAGRADRASELAAQRDVTKSGLTTTTIPVRRELAPHSRTSAAAASNSIAGAAPPARVPQANSVASPILSAAEPQGADTVERKTLRLGQSVLPASAVLPLE